jgi:hypothetical protein
MIKYLYGKISANHWFPSQESEFSSLSSPGCLLRRVRGEYFTEPERIDAVLLHAAIRINAEVAFTMATETTHVIFSSMQQYQPEILLPGGSQLQVIDSLSDIAHSGKVKKFQYAALVRRERILLVWHDEMDKILHHAAAVEEKLLALVSHHYLQVVSSFVSGQLHDVEELLSYKWVDLGNARLTICSSQFTR